MFKKSFLLFSLSTFLALPVCAAGVFDTQEQAVEISPANKSTVSSTSVQAQEVVGGTNFKQAISNIEDAQTVVRQDLAIHTAKYNEAKGRYDVSKEECRELKKQIREINSKIKNTEKAKKLILKNLPQQQL